MAWSNTFEGPNDDGFHRHYERSSMGDDPDVIFDREAAAELSWVEEQEQLWQRQENELSAELATMRHSSSTETDASDASSASGG